MCWRAKNYMKDDFQLQTQGNQNTVSSNANKIGTWCHVGMGKALEIDIRYFTFKGTEKYMY